MRTGWSSLRHGLGFLFIPFLFFYSPLLLTGDMFDILMTIATAIFGVIALSGGFERFLLTRLGMAERIILGISGILLVWPKHAVSIAGLVIMAGSLVLQAKTRRSPAGELRIRS
jgi:TRAP-type uncharacterized transport system fused permease subunit